jgi:hypothetical protein
MNRMRLLEEEGMLILKDRDEKKEIEFELSDLSLERKGDRKTSQSPFFNVSKRQDLIPTVSSKWGLSPFF